MTIPVLDPPSFTCPICGAVSHHPMDVIFGYCGRCHDWTGRGCSSGRWSTDDDPCMFCHPDPPTGAPFDPGAQHPECGLRGVLGGIGHLTDHAYWCGQMNDPDMGLGYRESARRVWAWVQTHGVEAAVTVSYPTVEEGTTDG